MKRNNTFQHSVFLYWVNCHARAIVQAFRECIQSPVTTIITLCIISVGITLPLCFYVILKNMEQLSPHWQSQAPTISLYIQPSTSQTQITNWMEELKHDQKIAALHYISPEQGLKSFEAAAGLNHLQELLDKNPLPGVLIVLPTPSNQTPDAIQVLFQILKASPLVSDAQIDMNWVKRWHEILNIWKSITHALIILFGTGVLLIIISVLRSSILNRQTEIQILQLMGATHAFIQRPLWYRGVFYSIFGGFTAWILTNLFISHLTIPVKQLASTYHSYFQLNGLSPTNGFFLLLICVVFGWIGSWFIVRRVLKQFEAL